MKAANQAQYPIVLGGTGSREILLCPLTWRWGEGRGRGESEGRLAGGWRGGGQATVRERWLGGMKRGAGCSYEKTFIRL